MRPRWTRLSIADLEHAYHYAVAEDPPAAERLIHRIEDAAAMLVRHPSAGRAGRLPGTRVLVAAGTPFVIPYRIRAGTVEILAVISCRSQVARKAVDPQGEARPAAELAGR